MPPVNKQRTGDKAINIKVVITCLLACAVTMLSLYVIRDTFTGILNTVDHLSKPNQKLQLVNSLFREVVKLDQQQRTNETDPQDKAYAPFLDESHSIQEKLDTLRGMSGQNAIQVARIDSMKKMLYQRDLIYLQYAKLHTAFVKNDTLAGQVKQLTTLIEKAQHRADNNVITTSRDTKVTIDTLEDPHEKSTLWNRLFAKKKGKKQVQKKVEEVLKVRVDTIGHAGANDSLVRMDSAITHVEHNRLFQRKQLTRQQEDLNQANELFIGQLISILDDIETEELQLNAAENATAEQLVDKSIHTLGLMVVVFILATGILGALIFIDVSRSGRYRKELIIAKEQADEAGLVKQRFLANMSHELRTPLQTIIGLSELIRNEPQPAKQDIEHIFQSSNYLLQIVNEVLDYSRIVSGKYTLDIRPFNMHDLVHEVLEMIAVQASAKRLNLKKQIDVPVSQFYLGDKFRLKQILLNLLGNAVKFTDAGSVTLKVTTAQQAQGATAFTFIVADTGAGISAQDKEIIFNQFEQGSKLNAKPGTGLGLSIVKALTDIQQGTIAVDSNIGKGTTFTLSLSYAETSQGGERSNQIQQKPVGQTPYVWVVDDDAFILQLCDNILNKHHIPHTVFSSAAQVLADNTAPKPGIILMDIRMPEIDGITLCNQLKQAQLKTTYIALTAQALPDEREAILNEGFDGLVMKPFMEQDLLNAIYQYTIAVDETPVTDLSTFIRMTGGDTALLTKVLHTFVAETKQDVDSARQHMANGDGAQLAESMHKLAGRTGQAGNIAVSHQLRKIQIALDEKPEVQPVLANITLALADVNTMIAVIEDMLAKGSFPS